VKSKQPGAPGLQLSVRGWTIYTHFEAGAALTC
jgi:hypothetical protein